MGTKLTPEEIGPITMDLSRIVASLFEEGGYPFDPNGLKRALKMIMKGDFSYFPPGSAEVSVESDPPPKPVDCRG